jgi:hypothetical protein
VPLSHHLVTVWNPAYAADAMEAHLAVLLDRARRYEREEFPIEDVYVWWGKVRSSNRQQPYPHAADVRGIARALDDGQRDEVQLYLTDFRSLYVADMSRIVEGELPTAERDRVPAYYARERLSCDFWFRLDDIRRLVSDDTLGVVAELKKLRNVKYGLRPVSVYGGMVDLPLIVDRPDGRRWFDETERDLATDGKLWVELDAELGSGVGATMRALREDRFGDALWEALETSARTFVATAELTWRAHRSDHAFDFAPVLGSFAKAAEVQTNALLGAAMAGAPVAVRLTNVEGSSVDLAGRPALSLGQLARAIGGDRERSDWLATRLENGRWFVEQWAPALADLAQARNTGAHSERVDRETASRWRDRLIGVGCLGDLLELARTTVRPLRDRSPRQDRLPTA